MSEGYLYLDPWSGKWLTRSEYVEVIWERIALSQTWRYRLARRVEIMRGRPFRPATLDLVHKVDAVYRIEPHEETV